MTPLEAILRCYLEQHPNCSRRVVIDALGHDEWDTQHRIRVMLDSLVERGIIQKHGESKRNVRYTIGVREQNALDQADGTRGDN